MIVVIKITRSVLVQIKSNCQSHVAIKNNENHTGSGDPFFANEIKTSSNVVSVSM